MCGRQDSSFMKSEGGCFRYGGRFLEHSFRKSSFFLVQDETLMLVFIIRMIDCLVKGQCGV